MAPLEQQENNEPLTTLISDVRKFWGLLAHLVHLEQWGQELGRKVLLHSDHTRTTTERMMMLAF